MRTSHRLDVLAVPADPDAAPVEEIRAWFAELVDGEVIDVRGRPARHAARWMPEGFRGLRLDQPGRIALYGNRQGGFRVFCPIRDEIVTEAFSRTYSEARGEPRPDRAPMTCPACGGVHELAETIGRPAFRFARVAVQTIDAEALRPAPAMERQLLRVLGDVAWVDVRT